MSQVDVIHFGAPSLGWGPVDRMASLAAELLEGTYETALPHQSTVVSKLLAPTRHRSGGPHDRGLLVIARRPYDLRADILPPGLMRAYGWAVAWVIDSFRHEDIPKRWRIGPYDAIAVSRPNDEEPFRRAFRKPVLVLPWGTDALRLGSEQTARDIDVMRLGRQPPAWDDDEKTHDHCSAQGLVFSGRPPQLDDPLHSHAALMRHLSRSRFVIAHSNLVSPAPYTHRTQDYLTGRWTDALAAGAIVAGIPPEQDRSVDMLWPEALLHFDRIDLPENIAALAQAHRRWTDRTPLYTHRMALERLDWRWRFQTLTDHLGLRPARLQSDLEEIAKRIAALDTQLQSL